jgi:hypothetical protein
MGSFWSNFAPPPPPPPALLPPPPPPPGVNIPWYAQTARRGAGHFRNIAPPPPPPPAMSARALAHFRQRQRASEIAQRRMHFFGPGGFGAFGASCPPGWTQTPHGNCGGPTPPNYVSPLATNLQNALRALGKAVGGDAQLLAVSTDGVIGPSTTAAVNRAFTTHIGAGQAGGVPRTGALTMFDVAAQVSPITTAIQNETVRRGGALSVPKPSGGGGGGTTYTPPAGGPAAADASAGPSIPTTTWAIVGGVLLAAGAGAYFLLRGGGGSQSTYSVRAGKRYAVV